MNHNTAVSNTSPLIFLSKIDSLHLLNHCFTEIIIPDSVFAEWGAKSLPSFITIESLSQSSKSYVEGAIGRLHRGELETVRLAIEKNIKYVLLDDLLARRYAERNGLIPVGILGILRIACHRGAISLPQLKNKVNELVNTHNLFVSRDVLDLYWSSFS